MDRWMYDLSHAFGSVRHAARVTKGKYELVTAGCGEDVDKYIDTQGTKPRIFDTFIDCRHVFS